MADVLYGFTVAWLSVGFGLWMSVDAQQFVDQTSRAYLKRCRRLPSLKLLLAYSALIVVAWPWRVAKILDSIEARRRGRA